VKLRLERLAQEPTADMARPSAWTHTARCQQNGSCCGEKLL